MVPFVLLPVDFLGVSWKMDAVKGTYHETGQIVCPRQAVKRELKIPDIPVLYPLSCEVKLVIFPKKNRNEYPLSPVRSRRRVC
jgi:hypothetical protein